MVGTNTDNLGPNYVDVTLNEKAVINAGITIGIAGDAKQDAVGLDVPQVAAL